MSDQLWTSPLTGYRRRGTRIAEMRAIVGASITAGSICEPLQSCAFSAPVDVMRAQLAEREFDVAGVRAEKKGPLLGVVYRVEMSSGTVGERMRMLSTQTLVSDSAPLGELLAALRDSEHVLVVIGRGIDGIITRADLNKPPVRTYLFGLVSLLEMHLGYWVRATYDGSSWEASLRPERVEEARQLQSKRAQRNDEAPLFACLQICDKRDLLVKHAPVRETLGLGSRTNAERLFRRVEGLRNDLAHSQPTLVGVESWVTLIELVSAVERIVDRSDTAIEARARNLSTIELAMW